MIRNENKFNVKRGGNIEEVAFTIEADAAAFEALSADLYTNRVQAPIRELAANAADAHVAAGTQDTPFVIHIPTKSEPFFSIRDYGTGLSREEIEKLYTRYFKSTKTTSNEYIGCKGLGSKTPFAYVDNFMVTSYHNGKKMVFNCFKNENRCPATAFLGEDDTTEHNGLEVSFAVESGDVWQFHSELKNVLKFFSSKPTLTGVSSFPIEEINYLLKNENFGITSKSDSSCVIMGNVSYPFDESAFSNTAEALNEAEKKILNWGIHLFAPIGTVEVAINREKLTYTKETRCTVKRLLTEAMGAVLVAAQKQLAEAKNIWDARVLISTIMGSVLGSLLPEDVEFVWNGKVVKQRVTTTDINENMIFIMEHLTTESSPSRNRRRKWWVPSPSKGNKSFFSHEPIENFDAKSVKLIFISDLDHGSYAAAKRHMNHNGIKNAVMIHKELSQEEIDKIGFGHLLVKTSSIPKVERKARVVSEKSEAGFLVELLEGNLVSVFDIDLKQGGIYLEIKHGKLKFKNSSYYSSTHVFPSMVGDIVESMEVFDFSERIFCVRPSGVERLKAKGKWIDLKEKIDELIEQNKELFKIISISDAIRHSIPARFLTNVTSIVQSLDLNHPVTLFFNEIVEHNTKAKNNFDKIEAFKILAKNSDTFFFPDSDQTICNSFQSLNKSFPLLGEMGWNWKDGNNSAVVEYLNFIYKKNSGDA